MNDDQLPNQNLTDRNFAQWEHLRKVLQEKEEQLRTLIDAMPDIVVFKDGEGRYLQANDFNLRFFGLEGVDYRGKTDAELAEFTPFYREAFQGCLASDELAWNAGTMSRCDEVIPRPDGSVRVFDVIKAPTFHPDGSRKGLVVVGRDVTERKQAEEALRKAYAELEQRVEERTAELRIANAQLRQEIEERKRVEAILRVAEEEKSLILNSTLDLVVYHSTDMRILWANQTAAASVNMEQDALIGRCCWEIWHQRSEPCVGCPAVLALQTGQPHMAEMSSPDGRKWFVRGHPLNNGKGQLIGVAEFCLDITERKRAEEELQRSRETALHFSERLAALQEITNQLSRVESYDDLSRRAVELGRARLGFDRIGIWFVGERLGVARGSFGIDEQGQLRDERGMEVEFGPDEPDWQLLYHRAPTVIVQREPLYDHHRRQVGDGSRAVATLWDGDETIGLISVDNLLNHQPITEQQLEILRLYATTLGYLFKRKQAEEAREQLAAQVREQAKRMMQILATVPTGVLLLDGDGRVIQANPVAKRDLVVLAGAKEGDRLTHLGGRPLAELLTSPPTRGLWHEVKAAKRTFEIIARPVENGASPEHWVLVINDATREREIQAQLQQQERLAAVGQLAAGISHDFNNLMAVIVLYAQMALRTPEFSVKTRERLEIIAQQARRATDLTQQILDFSRRAVLEPRPLDLIPFLKEIVKLLERTVLESIKLDLRYGMDEYIVNADSGRLQQVILNLAVNARDAMPQGGELRITLSQTGQKDKIKCVTCGQVLGGEWVSITVTDNGSGIPSTVLPHIFEPFYTTKEPGKGSGLGLAQVYGIVKQHGGHVDVVTKAGEGTTFTLYLPALQERQPERSTVENQTLVRGYGETILIVEDDAVLREALVAGVELLNYRVLEAANGIQALGVLKQHHGEVALVLSDLVMPEMGGQALFQAIRQRGLSLPVVILTGHPMENELQSLQAQGLAGWLPKPPEIEQLARSLARALGREAESGQRR
ncbi:MAG: PAS domain-containing protein [Anaerolineae bacterium]|nr:PAS domain-containing protein [Anaerolineae bacterium]